MERNEGLEEEFNRVMMNSLVVRLIHRQAESQGWSDVDALKACVVYLFSSNETLIQKCVDMSLRVPVEFFAERTTTDDLGTEYTDLPSRVKEKMNEILERRGLSND